MFKSQSKAGFGNTTKSLRTLEMEHSTIMQTPASIRGGDLVNAGNQYRGLKTVSKTKRLEMRAALN